MKSIVEKIKEIEKLVCEHFEELELDDPEEEGTLDEYASIKGADDEQIEEFEKHFDIKMPEDMKEIYRYKNGSGWFFPFFPDDEDKRDFKFRLLPLEKIKKLKKVFQSENTLFSEAWCYTDDDEIPETVEDGRIKPYLFNKKWIPFAETYGDMYLMMDFDPNKDGSYGQIICYIHDPDEIIYVAESITEVIDDTINNITDIGDE